ncbi:MAG: hypothetical protein QW465_00420 [Candidatus Anstonellales archaeon]
MLLILGLLALLLNSYSLDAELLSLEVNVYLNPDLTLQITEQYKIIVYNIEKYVELSSSKNATISDWREFINDSRFGFHISGDGIFRENLQIDTSQIYLKNYRSGFADITIKYNIRGFNRDYGVFYVKNTSPRYEIIELNPNYLTFTRTGNRYILLSSNEAIRFRFHPSFSIIEIQPTPISEGDVHTWTNTVLNNPRIILRRSISYDQLVIEGILDIYSKALTILSSTVSIIYIIITLVFMILTVRVVRDDK